MQDDIRPSRPNPRPRPMSMEFTNSAMPRRPVVNPVNRSAPAQPLRPAPRPATPSMAPPASVAPRPAPSAPLAQPVQPQPTQPQPQPRPTLPPQTTAQPPATPQYQAASQLPPVKKNRKKALILGSIGLGALVIFIASLFLTNNIALSKFKSVTYNNGVGTTFQVKFYSRSSTQKVAKSLATPNPSVPPNLTQLVSKVSVGGKSPIILWAETTNIDSAAYTSNDCTKNKLPQAFDTRIDYINATVPVCVVKVQKMDLIYLVTFHDDKHNYVVNINQVADYRTALSSTASAKALLDKIGMAGYQADIQTILASLKPVN